MSAYTLLYISIFASVTP